MFDDWATRPELVRGYIGPQVLAKLGIRYLVDPRVAVGTAWLTGANEPGRHAVDVVCGRDFTPDGTIEAAEVRAGDPCPACGDGALTMRRGIEIGHVFQLGRRYTDAFGVDALGADGKPVRPTMGCYGIGISRAVAAVAEQHHDERGLVLAGRDRAGRRTPGGRRKGRPGRRRRSTSAGGWPRGACGCWSTTAPTSRPG